MGTTVNYSLPWPDGTSPVVVHSDVKKLADMTDEKLKTTNDRADAAVVAIDNAAFYKGAQGLPMPPDRIPSAPWWDALDLLGSKVHTIWNGAVAERYGMPTKTLGSIEVHRWGAAGGTATWKSRSLIPEEWITSRLSGGWVDWVRSDAGGVVVSGGGSSSGSSGTKTIPLALTLGHGGGVDSPLSGTVVIPTDWNAPILRWRIAVRDGNPRFGVVKSNATTFTNVKANGVTTLASVTMPAGTEVFNFPWVAGSPNQSIEYTYSSAVAPYGMVAGGTLAGVAQVFLPFEMWVEVEVPSWVPVIAVGGDSNACGVGTARPVHDSWLSQYCRRVGALPVHYAASGDSYEGWAADDASHKWARWDHLSKPDVFINAWGSNDAAKAGATIESVMGFAEAVWDIAASKVSANQHVITVKPRNGGDANYNTVRRGYNERVKKRPHGLREWHDMVTPVSADDTVMLPGTFAPDGTHMTTAGHSALEASITKSIIARPAPALTEDPADPGFYLIGG